MPIEAAQQFKELSAEEQAAYFHARTRRMSHSDLMKGLHRTHNFTWPQQDLDPVAYFGDRERPITFATRIKITGDSPNGLIVEWGGSLRGMFIGISSDGGFIEVASGTAGKNSDGDAINGAHGTYTPPGLTTIGAMFRIVYAISPGFGAAELWVNGESVDYHKTPRDADAVYDAFGGNGVWCGTDTGNIGAKDESGSDPDTTPNISLLRTYNQINTDPTDFVLIEPVSTYQGQLPRAFQGIS